MNPRTLLRHLSEAGYHTRLDAVVAALDTGEPLRVRDHELRIRCQAGAGRELSAVAVHCSPPILVATEGGVYVPRVAVPPPMPPRTITVPLPGAHALELSRRAGPNVSLPEAVRRAVAWYLEEAR